MECSIYRFHWINLLYSSIEVYQVSQTRHVVSDIMLLYIYSMTEEYFFSINSFSTLLRKGCYINIKGKIGIEKKAVFHIKIKRTVCALMNSKVSSCVSRALLLNLPMDRRLRKKIWRNETALCMELRAGRSIKKIWKTLENNYSLRSCKDQHLSDICCSCIHFSVLFSLLKLIKNMSLIYLKEQKFSKNLIYIKIPSVQLKYYLIYWSGLLYNIWIWISLYFVKNKVFKNSCMSSTFSSIGCIRTGNKLQIHQTLWNRYALRNTFIIAKIRVPAILGVEYQYEFTVSLPIFYKEQCVPLHKYNFKLLIMRSLPIPRIILE